MSKGYDVDDILREIQEKKRARSGGLPESRPAAAPAQPRQAAEEPPRPAQSRPAPAAPAQAPSRPAGESLGGFDWGDRRPTAPAAPAQAPSRPAGENFGGFDWGDRKPTAPAAPVQAPSRPAGDNLGGFDWGDRRPTAPAAPAQAPSRPAGENFDGFDWGDRKPAAPADQSRPAFGGVDAPAQQAPARSQGFVVNWTDEEDEPADPRPSAPAFRQAGQDATRVDIPVTPRSFGSRVVADEFGGGGLEPMAGDSVYEEDEPGGSDDEDLLEYRKPSDARAVHQDLFRQRSGLLIRLMVTGLCAVVLLYLALSYEYPLPLPTFLWPENHIRAYFIVNLALTLIAVVVNSNTVGGGFLSLVTLKADNDSFAAIASLAALIQAVALVAAPGLFTGARLYFYTPVAVLILFFNTLGKLGLAGRVLRGFRVVAGERRARCATMMVTSKELAREMTRGQNLDYPQIIYPVRTGFLSNYLELSYEEDYSDGVARVLAPVSLAACLLMSLVSFLFSKSAFNALTVFAAACCVCAPLGAQLAANLPMGRLSKALGRENALVSGYGAVERLSRANAVALRCSDLFPDQSITLHKIKTFRQAALDEAIIDAASVICSCESTLGGIFNQMVGGRTDILKPVENLVSEDGMGLSAWVNGKRVLIGNRELMRQHGISLPGPEFEAQLTAGGCSLLYLANSGELTAVYVLSYGCDEAVAEALEELSSRDMTLVVYTTDPNITPGLIQDVLGYPSELVKILPAKLHATFEELTQPRESCRVYAAHDGSIQQFVRTVTSAENCRGAVTFASVLQMIFVILGFALVTFMAFMQNMSAVSWMLLCLFQLVCCGLVCLLPNMRRM